MQSPRPSQLSPRSRLIYLALEHGGIVFSPTVEVVLTNNAVHLEPAFPNPFRVQTTLRFAVTAAGPVTAELFDIRGQRVRTLYTDTPEPNALNTLHINAVGLSSGSYVVRVTEAHGVAVSKRILLIK